MTLTPNELTALAEVCAKGAEIIGRAAHRLSTKRGPCERCGVPVVRRADGSIHEIEGEA